MPDQTDAGVARHANLEIPHVDLTTGPGLPISPDPHRETLSYLRGRPQRARRAPVISNCAEVLADRDAATDDRLCYLTHRGRGTKPSDLLDRHCSCYDSPSYFSLIDREFNEKPPVITIYSPDALTSLNCMKVPHERPRLYWWRTSYLNGWVQICKAGERIVIPFRM